MSSPINLPPYGSGFVAEGAVLATLKPEPQADPDLTVNVSPGGFWVNGKSYLEYPGGNSGAFTPPPSQAKWDLLVFNYSGFLQIITGTSSANPALPNAPRNSIVLAAIYLESTTTKITTENMFDMRPVFVNPIYSHNDLDDRSQINQHPMSSITGLETALTDRPNSTDLSTLLETKADTGGTPEVTFTLNQDLTGTPSSDVKLAIERGLNTNVEIRWNEAINNWDYTNDNGRYIFQPNIFISNEQTGTGVPQNIAHDLGRTPTKVFVSITDTNAAGGSTYSVVEGIHTSTEFIVTVSTDIKFKIMAF